MVSIRRRPPIPYYRRHPLLYCRTDDSVDGVENHFGRRLFALFIMQDDLDYWRRE